MELNTGWESKKISSVCTLVNGRGFKPHEWKNRGLPIIRIQNLNGSDNFNFYDGSYDPKIEVENGQLLFAWSGSRGTSFGPHVWKGSKGLLNYHTWKVVIRESEINKDFFLYALKNLTKHIEDNAHGASALVHTQKWEMEAFGFLCPINKKEQQAIAQVLSDTDQLIQSLEKKIAKKKLIKQSVMQKLLTPREGWKVKKLGDICSVYSGGTPSSSNPNYYRGEINWITSGELNQGFIKSVEGHISKEGLNNSAAKMVNKNTLLIAMYGATAGVSAITQIQGAINQAVLAIIPDAEISNLFLFYKFQLRKDWIIDTYTQGGQPNLSGSIIKSIEFSCPESLDEQIEIERALLNIDYEINDQVELLAKYQLLKQALMQQLLTGKIRLSCQEK